MPQNGSGTFGQLWGLMIFMMDGRMLKELLEIGFNQTKMPPNVDIFIFCNLLSGIVVEVDD